jgi:alkylation response protein AidB-like acyl-CoA dehydrogenase
VDVQHADRPPADQLHDVWIPEDSYWGQIDRGLGIGQSFVHQNRIRQAASSLGAAQFCVNESVKYARTAQAVRQAAGGEPGDPVAADRAADPVRDAAAA